METLLIPILMYIKCILRMHEMYISCITVHTSEVAADAKFIARLFLFSSHIPCYLICTHVVTVVVWFIHLKKTFPCPAATHILHCGYFLTIATI